VRKIFGECEPDWNSPDSATTELMCSGSVHRELVYWMSIQYLTFCNRRQEKHRQNKYRHKIKINLNSKLLHSDEISSYYAEH
jgi:hypothetical protein